MKIIERQKGGNNNSMRQTISLMKDWMFTGKTGKTRLVDLPHTWNDQDGQDGGNDYYRGTCVYEKKLQKPEFKENERVYLQFHGVNASATVILNGKELCKHDNGYSTFRMDVTDELKEENELRVEVDNSVNDRVYPQKADFTFYGGIYREVEFLIVNEEHFDLDYYGGPGIKVKADVKNGKGILKVKPRVRIDDMEEKGLKVVLELKDAEGNVVGTAEGLKAIIEVPNVHLWHGVKDPYLYHLTASLKRGETVLDEIYVNCGFRTFKMDPNKGFILNGEIYPLRGVSRHQDWKGIGNAISHAHMDQDMDLIREVGANTIRLAHY